MQVISTIDGFRAARAGFGQLGLVPTMGFLHEGHLSLVRRARGECGAAAASIFVNPTQFAPTEDLARYPRDVERDLALLREAGTDLVFAPDVAEMYPSGFATRIEVGAIGERLEGAIRPGHFSAVATVVCKLLGITRPERAYFGQKDAQQSVVVRRVVRDLDLPVEIVVAPTVREADGLALSSRNVYLDPAQRAAAPALYRALCAAAGLARDGERRARVLTAAVRDAVAAVPGFTLDYASLVDAGSFADRDTLAGAPAFLVVAVRAGATRLLDNLLLDERELPPG